MNTKEFKIKYSLKDKTGDALLKATSLENGNILLEYLDNEDSISNKDPHLFVSFKNIRKVLESKNKFLLCKGCRKDVHPSGRQLIGRYAYKLSLGQHVDPKLNEVMIFDEEINIEKIGTVDEQEEYYKEWLSSIGATGSFIPPQFR